MTDVQILAFNLVGHARHDEGFMCIHKRDRQIRMFNVCFSFAFTVGIITSIDFSTIRKNYGKRKNCYFVIIMYNICT